MRLVILLLICVLVMGSAGPCTAATPAPEGSTQASGGVTQAPAGGVTQAPAGVTQAPIHATTKGSSPYLRPSMTLLVSVLLTPLAALLYRVL